MKQFKITIILLSIIAPLLTLFGMENYSILSFVENPEIRDVVLSLRFPRGIVSFLSGGILAMVGLVYQALFHNSLASPFTLGVASGASLGAAVALLFGMSSVTFWGLSPLVSTALIGALVVTMAILRFQKSGRILQGDSLLLAGVVISTLTSSLIMLLHYIGGEKVSFQILRWTMGRIEGLHMSDLFLFLPLLLIGVTLLFKKVPILDHFTTGEEIAHLRGVDVKRERNQLVLITALLVGIMVSLIGPIGFVGIVSPHLCRLVLTGKTHRDIALYVFLTGGLFLTFADTIARSILPGAEVPVGIITALIGGPVFLLVLLYRR